MRFRAHPRIAEDKRGTALINHWQCGVPVNRGPIVTPLFIVLAIVAAVGLATSALRLFSPLGPYSAMNDLYAWGIWKTFNVMTLTALGSGPLAVGIAAWIFNRHKLHTIMRATLVSGFLFYATGLVALGFDVGRPWNFYNAALPWRWNYESPMLEISICMPLYCAVFLLYEVLPMILERFYYTGGERARAVLLKIAPGFRVLYPFMLVGAYIIPLMHQSSLGGLLLLAGYKIHPLWQTPVMPLLYLIAAGICGFGFVTFLMLIVCLRYSRPLDLGILSELGNLTSWTIFGFLAVQFLDLLWRGQLVAAFAFNKMSLLFLAETAMLLFPALMLRNSRLRETPRALLNMSALACLGGMFYRFIPTSIAYRPDHSTNYYPSVSELIMAAGYISVGILAFILAVNYFAILPGESSSWDHTFRPILWRRRKPDAMFPLSPPATERGI